MRSCWRPSYPSKDPSAVSYSITITYLQVRMEEKGGRWRGRRRSKRRMMRMGRMRRWRGG